MRGSKHPDTLRRKTAAANADAAYVVNDSRSQRGTGVSHTDEIILNCALRIKDGGREGDTNITDVPRPRINVPAMGKNQCQVYCADQP